MKDTPTPLTKKPTTNPRLTLSSLGLMGIGFAAMGVGVIIEDEIIAAKFVDTGQMIVVGSGFAGKWK